MALGGQRPGDRRRRTQIGQLSGGQPPRVFVARALAQEVEVLLLDEPLSGIDAQTQEVIRAIIEEDRQAGTIVLLATHDLVTASGAGDCLSCLNQRPVSYRPTQETYTPETLAATYGGHPQHRHVHALLGREPD
jgi:ABC-type Mn2+/Zn2+ transport system ATPase subunit